MCTFRFIKQNKNIISNISFLLRSETVIPDLNNSSIQFSIVSVRGTLVKSKSISNDTMIANANDFGSVYPFIVGYLSKGT